MRAIALVPALNEEGTIAPVVDELRAFDAELEILVIDDGSHDRTAEVARARRRARAAPAVQPRHRRRRADGLPLRVRERLRPRRSRRRRRPARSVAARARSSSPSLRGETDIAVGSRYLGARGDGYRSSATRRVGIRILARVVSLLTRQRITDPTSGFQALNRKAITLFAADYPHDYPEVEAIVLVERHRLRLVEVPIAMRPRAAGRSSIRTLSSVYYMVKVLLALFVGTFRRYSTPLEEK